MTPKAEDPECHTTCFAASPTRWGCMNTNNVTRCDDVPQNIPCVILGQIKLNYMAFRSVAISLVVNWHNTISSPFGERAEDGTPSTYLNEKHLFQSG